MHPMIYMAVLAADYVFFVAPAGAVVAVIGALFGYRMHRRKQERPSRRPKYPQ